MTVHAKQTRRLVVAGPMSLEHLWVKPHKTRSKSTKSTSTDGYSLTGGVAAVGYGAKPRKRARVVEWMMKSAS